VHLVLNVSISSIGFYFIEPKQHYWKLLGHKRQNTSTKITGKEINGA